MRNSVSSTTKGCIEKMKKVKMLLILLITIFGIINFAYKTLIPNVDATYVEGTITQDTIWTLVDSPFVIANNVTVTSGVTLTIEPGVQVRFGGDFSLIVLGKLHADGNGKQIIFTSNRLQPEAGDWHALIFNSVERSVLIDCSISYAKNGTFVKSGNLEINNCTISNCSENGLTAINSTLQVYDCTISNCSQNGIDITDSELTIQKTTIAENYEAGINIMGNGQVIIQENTITANGNGILLTGNETSNIDIRRNIIGANEQAGIKIEAETHSNIAILNNIVTSNNYGFYISTPTSTIITNNSISYNKIAGIQYTEGKHEAHYNDIYENEKGMDIDASSNATVNAEYNYWGDPSGPRHIYLNPEGRGNEVGGDGVNLDFVFFLAKSVSRINTRPTAILLTNKLLARPNEEVMFFATNSFDNDGRVDKYLFSFGDGTDSGWTTLSVFTHKYLSLRTYNAALTVMDDNGTTSESITTTITVQNLQLLQVNVDLNSTRVHEGEQVSVAIHVTNGLVAIENAAIKLFSVTHEREKGDFTNSSGFTDSDGYFTTTFTAPDITKLTNVRIVARASKSNYADGSDYEYLEVTPFLSVQITAEPNVVKSEATAQVSIYVKSNEEPIANASVAIASSEGTLSAQNGVTDSGGKITLIFTAPLATTYQNITITANATKGSYLNGIGETTIIIEPKILAVQVTTVTNVTLSNAKLNVTVHVEYDSTSISGASVSITAENGTFSASRGITDDYGNVRFIYTAPPTNEQANITIRLQAAKTGYANGSAELEIAVNPKTFNIQINAPNNIESGDLANVIVTVTCNEDSAPVANAIVTISSTYGEFSTTTKTTDSTGTCTFTFNATQTTIELPAIITANVTKNGYVNGGNQASITIGPKTQPGGGLPLLMMLLIIIPVIIAIVIIILIKLKIIVISTGEEVR